MSGTALSCLLERKGDHPVTQPDTLGHHVVNCLPHRKRIALAPGTKQDTNRTGHRQAIQPGYTPASSFIDDDRLDVLAQG